MDGITEKKEGTAGTEVVDSGFTDYRQYKAELDGELTRAAQSFVRIGFLLRVAEDTDILRESGYRNVTEFAAAEYGLDKSQVSRFININIRFSEDGYSDRLQERYAGFGYAKLAIMLSLPEEINAELPDSLSKADIQAVAEEIKAEAGISDIELAIEKSAVAPVQPEGQEETLLYRAVAQLCREQQDLFRKLWKEQESLENMQEVLAPMGENVFMVRIPGTGRLMITVREQETSITVVRTGEKERCNTEEFVAKIWGICIKGTTPEDAFRMEFGEEMEKPAAAPSGQGSQPAAAVEEKPKQRKVSKVTKARIPKPGPAAVMEGTPAAAVEEQLPGQMGVYDYPEIIPEEMKEGSHGTDEKGAAGGEDPAADGEMGSGTGAAGGGQDTIPEQHAVPGAAEDDGCAEDPKRIAAMTAEDTAWEEAWGPLNEIRERMAAHWGQEWELGTDQVQQLYKKAISLAAALEKVLMIRGRNHE